MRVRVRVCPAAAQALHAEAAALHRKAAALSPVDPYHRAHLGFVVRNGSACATAVVGPTS